MFPLIFFPAFIDSDCLLSAIIAQPHLNACIREILIGIPLLPIYRRHERHVPERNTKARALRRLDPAIDPRPLLPPLLDVVRAGRDIDRIPAAEAILLLAGPVGWSAYD